MTYYEILSPTLYENFFSRCPKCHGTGKVLNTEPLCQFRAIGIDGRLIVCQSVYKKTLNDINYCGIHYNVMSKILHKTNLGNHK